MLRRRRPAATSPPLLPLLDTVAKNAMARQYRSGLRDGMKITLELLLGNPINGAPPYAGSCPPELVEWAERALARLEQP